MSDAFSTAIATLFADDNLSAAATYTPHGGAAVSVKVLKPSGQPAILEMGQARGGGSGTHRFELLQSEVETKPPRNSTLVVGGASFVIEGAKSGADGLVWALDVRPSV